MEVAYRFCVEGLRPELYPLVLSPQRVREVMHHVMSTTRDFHLAAFDGQQMVGGVAAVVTPMLWFERSEANVVMCRAVRPGVGRRLIDDLIRWAREDMRIKRVLFPVEFDAPAAMTRYLRMRGFNQPQAFAVAYT